MRQLLRLGVVRCINCLCWLPRLQAFPDFHVFVGLEGGTKYGSGKGVRIVAERYLQVGWGAAHVEGCSFISGSTGVGSSCVLLLLGGDMLCCLGQQSLPGPCTIQRLLAVFLLAVRGMAD